MKLLLITILLFYSTMMTAQPNPTVVTNLDTKGVNIVKVEIVNFQYRVHYFDSAGNFKLWIKDITPNYIYTNSKWKFFNFSVMTIPFKVRPKIEGLKQIAKGDIKNAGLQIGVANKIWRSYQYDNTVNEYKLSFGVIIAPSAEEFNSLNTRGLIVTPTTQMVLSTGLTIAGTYRGINFAVIPIGTDFGLTTDSKSWTYNKKAWFGLALGLDSKLLGF